MEKKLINIKNICHFNRCSFSLSHYHQSLVYDAWYACVWLGRLPLKKKYRNVYCIQKYKNNRFYAVCHSLYCYQNYHKKWTKHINQCTHDSNIMLTLSLTSYQNWFEGEKSSLPFPKKQFLIKKNNASYVHSHHYVFVILFYSWTGSRLWYYSSYICSTAIDEVGMRSVERCLANSLCRFIPIFKLCRYCKCVARLMGNTGYPLFTK